MTVAVFYTTEHVAEVGQFWFEKLKRHAFEAQMKRARLCLHHSPDDPLHEMIIVFHRDAVIRPHRHTTKTESYHLIFGDLDVVLFDDAGAPTRVVSMGGASDKARIYRLSAPVWHSVVIRSEYAGIHEVTNGPFRIEDNDFAPWAPSEPGALRRYLRRATERLPKHHDLHG